MGAPQEAFVHIIDSHFHWWPRSVFEKLCKRKDFPTAQVNDKGDYRYMRRAASSSSVIHCGHTA